MKIISREKFEFQNAAQTTIDGFFRASVSAYPDHPAVVVDTETYTYSMLDKLAGEFSACVLDVSPPGEYTRQYTNATNCGFNSSHIGRAKSRSDMQCVGSVATRSTTRIDDEF